MDKKKKRGSRGTKHAGKENSWFSTRPWASKDGNLFFEHALKIAKEKNCIFISDIAAQMPCVTSYFYERIKSGTDQHKQIVEALTANRIAIKQSLRKKWLEGDAPATQIALYKLVGTRQEVDRLINVKKEDAKNNGVTFKIDYGNNNVTVQSGSGSETVSGGDSSESEPE